MTENKDRSGRLFRYDPSTNQTTMLLSGLAVASGVAVSRDGSFVLVELVANRVTRFWLKGPRANPELFWQLAGRSDNIKTQEELEGTVLGGSEQLFRTISTLQESLLCLQESGSMRMEGSSLSHGNSKLDKDKGIAHEIPNLLKPGTTDTIFVLNDGTKSTTNLIRKSNVRFEIVENDEQPIDDGHGLSTDALPRIQAQPMEEEAVDGHSNAN
ncbi:hypothetical protein RIF29_07777 [Crotalaria pallida]|uniref:Strictosidine synthase conserved region domain-containing protein n=1 Tax=Crotalaria pallida TaxID=3830 RepID=A0AAN9J5N0_CROPI